MKGGSFRDGKSVGIKTFHLFFFRATVTHFAEYTSISLYLYIQNQCRDKVLTFSYKTCIPSIFVDVYSAYTLRTCRYTYFSYICGIIYLDIRYLVVGWCVKCIIKCMRRIGGVLSFISFVSININGTFFNQLSLFNRFIHSFMDVLPLTNACSGGEIELMLKQKVYVIVVLYVE